MTIMTKILVTGTGIAGLAALASATPAAAQYRYGYGGAHFAAQRCAAAVDSRRNLEVVAVTRVDPRRRFVRVRGIATDVRMGHYGPFGPYGIGAYGALGYGYRGRADVTFSCTVDYRGRIRDIDINRRR